MKYLFCSIFLLALISGLNSQKVGELKFLETCQEVEFPEKIDSKLSAEEVGPLVGYVFGISNSYKIPQIDETPNCHPYKKPKASLVFFLEGVSDDLFESSLAEYDIMGTKATERNPELISRMLTGRKYNEGIRYHKGNKLLVTEPASVLDVVGQSSQGQSVIFTFASSPELAESLSLHQELNTKNNWNVFTYTLENGGLKMLNNKHHSNKELVEFFESILDQIDFEEISQQYTSNGKPVFDISNNNDRIFLTEVELLKSIISKCSEGETETESESALKYFADNYSDMFVFALSGVESVSVSHGVDSDAYKTAVSLMSTLIPQVSEKLSQVYHQKLVSQVITLRSDFAFDAAKVRNKRAAINPQFPCFDDETACTENTGNCTNTGSCSMVKQTETQQCWRCVCDKGYIGDSCEFEDITAEFHLILWSSVFLIVSVFLSVCLLAYSDDGNDSMLFRQQTRPKAD